MKTLSAFANSVQDTKRIERKFIMGQGVGILANSSMLANGFRPIHRKRQVCSIYYDDVDFNCLRDNVDGNPFRDKLRVRYYDDVFDNAKIEIKHKRNFFGYKSTFSLTGSTSVNDLIQRTSRWVTNNISIPLLPVSIVEYQRTYLMYKSIRATIDVQVRSSRIFNSQKIPSTFRDYEVVELKYDESEDNEIREVYDMLGLLALRLTKSSKYANSLMF